MEGFTEEVFHLKILAFNYIQMQYLALDETSGSEVVVDFFGLNALRLSDPLLTSRLTVSGIRKRSSPGFEIVVIEILRDSPNI